MNLNDDPILELSVFLNEQSMKLLDAIKLEIKENQKWIDDLIYQTRQESKIKKERCETCNSKEDPKDLERHHPAGEKHDYRRTTACKHKCHKSLSLWQKGFDARWKEENQPENLRQAFFLLGLQDILELKSMKSGNNIYKKLGESYTEKINALLGRWQN